MDIIGWLIVSHVAAFIFGWVFMPWAVKIVLWAVKQLSKIRNKNA